MMAYPKEDIKFRKKSYDFLKTKYGSTIKKNTFIFQNFAPDYYIKNGKKERIFILRNPPQFPLFWVEEIKIAQQRGIGIYLIIYDHEYDPLIEKLLEKCDQLGVGVIQCKRTYKFECLQPAITDYPKTDKIIEGRMKFFISSKLWLPEREGARKILIKFKHQPICVERLSNQGQIEEVCIELIDKSEFFIGVITPEYRSIVDKEIRYAIKKKNKKCLVYIRTDAFSTNKNKLKQLISHVKQKATYHKFSNENDLNRMIPTHSADLIGKHYSATDS